MSAHEKSLRSVYDAAIDVSFITVDLSAEFIIRSFSPGEMKMFEYSSNEVIGKPLRLFRLPNQSDLLPAIRHDFDEIGWSRREEIILRRKSGEYFIAMLTVYPLFDEDSKLIGALAVCIDISELKQTQHKLINAHEKAEKSEFHFRSLFEQASDGIFISDKKGNLLDVNENCCKMLGYKKMELLKLNQKDISANENPVKIDEKNRV